MSAEKTRWSGAWTPRGASSALTSATNSDGCSMASTAR